MNEHKKTDVGKFICQKRPTRYQARQIARALNAAAQARGSLTRYMAYVDTGRLYYGPVGSRLAEVISWASAQEIIRRIRTGEYWSPVQQATA